jgi:nucleoside-diphosphate-sugar epimerase
MIVAITGASGFVGGALLRHLLARRIDTVALVRRGVDLSTPSRTLPDLVELASCRASIDLTGIDVLVHCAAIPQSRRNASPEESAHLLEVNAEATKALARQAVAAGVRRFVLLSSAKVNGEATGPDEVFSANDTPAPVDAYAKSKLEAERRLTDVSATTSLETVIIRPPLIYGRGAKGNFEQLVRLSAKAWPLPLGAVRNSRSMIAIDNLTDLITIVLDHPAAVGQIFMASDRDDISTPDLIARLARLQGRRAWLPAVPPSLLRAMFGLARLSGLADRLTGSLRVDGETTRRILGWTPPLTIDEGLRRTVMT